MKFDCELFSCFPDERETLFFGGDTVLRIIGIIQYVGDSLVNYAKYMEPINAFSRMMNGLSVMEQPILTRKKHQKAMKWIIKDILRAIVWQLHQAEAPEYVRNLVLFHHSCASCVRLLYHELLSEYEWLNTILKSTSNDTLNIANIAVLFCHSDDITFMMEEDGMLSGAECLSLIHDMITISEMSLDVNIRFMWPSSMPKSMRSRLRNASLGLYGAACQCQFDDQSVTFSVADSKFSEDAQIAFQSRIESMIKQLSYVPPPPVLMEEMEEMMANTGKSTDVKPEIAVDKSRLKSIRDCKVDETATKNLKRNRVRTVVNSDDEDQDQDPKPQYTLLRDENGNTALHVSSICDLVMNSELGIVSTNEYTDVFGVSASCTKSLS